MFTLSFPIRFIPRHIAIAAAVWLFAATTLQAQVLLNPTTVPKFVNPLPLPAVIDATKSGNRNLTVTMSQFQQDLGLGLTDASGHPVLTTIWGYNGQYPGPTILAEKDQPITVKWLNRLVDQNNQPLPHLLPVDPTIACAKPETGVPLVAHLHGGHTESASDGLPNAWYTPFGQSTGPDFVKGEDVPYLYDNSQEAATLWYHDHVMGITRLNVYAGLAGFYLVTDGFELGLRQSRRLPDARYDIPLVIQDRIFTDDGQLYYLSDPEEEDDPSPSVLPEFFGNIVLVNGKAWPVLNVEPRQYRFRLLNGSDSRFYRMTLTAGVKMWQIASDDGLLPKPVEQNELVLGPGERKEVIIDFSKAGLWGKTIIIQNDAPIPFPDGDEVDADDGASQIMAFKVDVPLNRAYPLTPVPATFNKPLPAVPVATKTRKLILYEGEDEYGRLMPMLGTMDGGVMQYMEDITENPALNSTEIWEVYNLTPDAHPIHLHLVSFRVLSSQAFTGEVDEETGRLSNVQMEGPVRKPEPGQDGKKDTYPVYPGEMTRFIATFDREGLYVWHCHILSHEDHEMMRPYYVGTMPAPMMASQVQGPQMGKVAGEKAFDGGTFRVYPNPFATVATVQVNVAEPAMVAASLLDMSGRVVQEIPARQLPAGQHQFAISGADMPAGLYLVEVEVNNRRYRNKLVLSK